MEVHINTNLLPIILIIILLTTIDGGLGEKVCSTKKFFRSYKSLLTNIDAKVDPCDNFYNFACGSFVKNVEIGDDKSEISTFHIERDNVASKLIKIIEKPIQGDDPKMLKLLKTLYSSCMDLEQIESEGLGFVKKIFKGLGGWPVIGKKWKRKSFDWVKFMFHLRSIGWHTSFFFDIKVTHDLKNSSKRILTIDQESLPSEIYKSGLNNSQVDAYYRLLVNLATLFGANQNRATIQLKKAIEFKIKLAQIMVPIVEQRKNYTNLYNPMKIEALEKEIPGIPWLKVINDYLAPIEKFSRDDIVVIKLPQFLKRLQCLLRDVDKKVLANYMFSKLVFDAVRYLPKSFRDKVLEYEKIVSGLKKEMPRWRFCSQVIQRLPVALSWLYVKKFVRKYTKEKVTEMVEDVKSSFIEILQSVKWMDCETKKHALIKANNIISLLVYPDEMLDDDIMEEYYKELHLTPGTNVMGMIINVTNFDHLTIKKKFKQPLDRNDWEHFTSSYEVNAFYSLSMNFIELPGARVGSAFYDPTGPQYLNYGRVASVIGHEITHGFDSIGRQYDEAGNVHDWWNNKTNARFVAKSRCLVYQYGNYTIPELKLHLDGMNTLSENIADNAGVKIAYHGYLKWLKRNQVEPVLPGVPYTPKQLYWIATAQNRCVKYKNEVLEKNILLNVHAPGFARGLIPMMNSKEFNQDFKCPIGSPMNPKEKCGVW